ncbi:MAG TPA: hypothetical protein VMX35_04475 [Acidobacteriota bacterium]|nr:hypothetical protein [Acidobacteriota bacterium]
MPVKAAFISIAATMFLFGFFDGPSYSQSSTAVQNYKLKKLTLEYVSSPETFECRTVTGVKSSKLAIINDINANGRALYSSTMKP